VVSFSAASIGLLLKRLRNSYGSVCSGHRRRERAGGRGVGARHGWVGCCKERLDRKRTLEARLDGVLLRRFVLIALFPASGLSAAGKKRQLARR